jgi:hypothetical protein|tara:strand:- start:22911 stop:23552 length:642 start_codon:yes stop_codon:yes gene_type:complete
MNTQLLKKNFIDQLSSVLLEKGFNYIKSKEAFICKTEFGQKRFAITTYVYSSRDGFEINPGYHLRFDRVEEFYHKISQFEKKYHSNTATIGCSLENHLNNGEDKFRYYISNFDDIYQASEYYTSIFENLVDPFFEKYKSLESLDYLINSKPDKELSIINPIFRGMKGIIIAFFLEKESLFELIDTYSRSYETIYGGFYKAEYDRLVRLITKDL